MKANSILKEILERLATAGLVVIAMPHPYLGFSYSRELWRTLNLGKPVGKKKYNQFRNTFNYLRKKGYLDFHQENHQIYIGLTAEGKKRAGKFSIDSLQIKRPKKWDGKYGIVMFDVPNFSRIKRDALRGKLKELGFFRLQQSVWVYPYPCEREINFLREFFGLNSKQLMVVTGEIKNDGFLQKFFSL